MKVCWTILFFLLPFLSLGQALKPGFDVKEYQEILGLIDNQNAFFDTLSKRIPVGEGYKFVYKSSEVGLKNQWNYWRRDDGTGVVVIRGTVPDQVSWLENFYAAMIPAKGKLQINDSTVFEYQFADDSRAAVHVGWTIGVAHIGPAIAKMMEEEYKNGITDFIICGHSQGGALSYLVRSYLEYKLPFRKDIRLKTYCSAAPKPGNLYFAYDFDFMNKGGWAFRVVNAADWVPETAFSIQTLKDMNPVNPFMDVTSSLKSQKALVRWYLKGVYNKMNRSTLKAEKKYRKYLGDMVNKQIRKVLPQLKEPDYVNSLSYMPAGVQVVLPNEPAYFEKYVFTGKNIFVHHGLRPYLELSGKYYLNN
ncbi:lipase family protein [Flavihumibacter rivuli]|uniref:lipase family protein n=1 Tax=Flavihumibacter rivuli TaxID=2838156 RepID=UPI001BDF27BA|nr:lipase family protein [Flavihumibacter rivuli]ULQ55630.1 lipase family protein [Flavihumibacter rivuli]